VILCDISQHPGRISISIGFYKSGDCKIFKAVAQKIDKAVNFQKLFAHFLPCRPDFLDTVSGRQLER
jgi:hypothetical protein